jgi:NAD-dependent deacetylase
MLSKNLIAVAAWIAEADRIAIMSGAGLSKASGIPTYRDAGGLWTQGDNLRFADIETLQTDPQGFLGFWDARAREIAKAEPNAGHRALARLQRLRPGTTTLITQNVDGLLIRAGCVDVFELHGSLARTRCTRCGASSPPQRESRCLACLAEGRTVRPDVVMFGEALDGTFAEAELAAKRSQLYISVGTSALVQPAAGLAGKAAARGAKVVVVNPTPTALDPEADVVLEGKSEELLPTLVDLVEARLQGH